MSKYTEESSVEQPANALFQQLNWETYTAYDEVLSEEGDSSVPKLISGKQRV